MSRLTLLGVTAIFALAGCATRGVDHGTLGELDHVAPDVEDIHVADSLERAAESYRRYLAETSGTARTPEAMRRLADLQIEQAYGVLGSGEIVEMAAPDSASPAQRIDIQADARTPVESAESEEAFEQRISEREVLLTDTTDIALEAPDGATVPVAAGPREAIETYWEILETFPSYERNDQVLYQLSRAYDEIGEPDEAMRVMDRLVAEYPHSRYVDEVYFRRGEYYFVRKQYLDAEDAYGAVIDMGSTTSYYELALYKLGWTLYKQDLYEEALHNYIAMLDYRDSVGFDFEADYEGDQDHRLADTFRVISLSFSNLGGPEIVDQYFATHGHRNYADEIYGNLAEFYFAKLRYEDAASVYKSFIRLNPYHQESPGFGMRVVEIYGEAGFPLLVVEAKKTFATTYALDAEYWVYNDVSEAPEVVGFLKVNLTDLAGHYHALYQYVELVDARTENFAEAQRWYRQFLESFPFADESPGINYQLADLLLENEDFGDAAREYERTAYDYPEHEQAAAAGYAAVYSHRAELEVVTGARTLDVKKAAVESSLRFADTFPEHEQAPAVLGAAADDLYEMKDLERAIASARTLIDRYPNTDENLIRSAWAVVAHSSIDLSEYVNAEEAYSQVLALTDAEDESRPAVVDGLAAAIYKQGEQAGLLEDHRAAAAHFLRIKDVAPESTIRSSAEYDAAIALMQVEDWGQASQVLEEFRVTHPAHELGAEATTQLAFIYREVGQLSRSAAEHERMSVEAEDPEIRREALLVAGGLYDEDGAVADAIRVYEQYVIEYPRPLDVAIETRNQMAEIFESESDYERYYDELRTIIAVDKDAGSDRTDRSRYLAAKASLVLSEQLFADFERLELRLPFEQSLAEKQRRMDVALAEFERLVSYEVAETTAAATYYIAQIYFDFSESLLQSERPDDLSDAEMFDYEMVIEEEAYPFEERAIAIHEANFELLAGGVYNGWVQKSLDQLALLMPGRYAKNEVSGGYLDSIDTYAYRMPIAPAPGIDGPDETQNLTSAVELEEGL